MRSLRNPSKNNRFPSCAAGVGTCVLLILVSPACTRAPPIHLLDVPDGFSVELFADRIPNARQMALGDDGVVFVGTRTDGRVWALVDETGDGRADRRFRIAEHLPMPSGVAFHDGALYVAAMDRVLRYDEIEANLSNPPEPVVIRDDLPNERQHGWRFLGFGPDGRLYVPIGGPCNVCLSDDERFATILRMRPDGSELEIFAHGIRNTVGFDWDPVTGDLWFTENGRDNMGDDVPADELNHAPRPGMHFGFPFCHAGTVEDPEYSERPCSDFVEPAHLLGAHVAAIGMRFYTGDMFPADYRNQILIAEHGSWNRSTKVGYRVSIVRLEDGRVTNHGTFIEGWLQNELEWGRPADVMVMPDGSLLVSDDLRGAIYRVVYE